MKVPRSAGERRSPALQALCATAWLLLALAAPAPASGSSPIEVAAEPPLEGEPGTTLAGFEPSVDRGAWIAKVLYPTTARSAPGGARVASVRTETTYSGSATRLMVTGARYDAAGELWLQVALPVRPTGTVGWIAARFVRLSHTAWYVRISTGRRELRAYKNGHLRKRARVVVGAPRTPTPLGLFAVYERTRQANPRGFIGPWALHLTAFSNVLFRYGAGNGRVAIHGRGPAALVDPLGSARSNGCVRMDNRAIDWLRRRVGAGTPVEITR